MFHDESENDEFTVEEARTWYERQATGSLNLKSGDFGKKISIKPDWGKTMKSENDKYEVVEAALLARGGFGFATNDGVKQWEKTGNQEWLASYSSLVVLKDKSDGSMLSFIMTLFCDEITDGKKKSLKGNGYVKKNKDFNGYVFYHELDGRFSNGWKYECGKATHTVSQATGDGLGINLKLATTCSTYAIYSWMRECTDYYTLGWVDGELVGYSYTGTSCSDYMVYQGSYTVCEGDGSGGAGGGGGGYEPSTTPPDPCSQYEKCPLCGGYIIPGLKSGEITTGGTNSCPTCSCVPDVKFDDSFIDTKAECVYNKLKDSQLLQNLLVSFIGSEKYHVTYKVVDNITATYSTDPAFGRCVENGNTMDVFINSYYFSKQVPVALAKTILHETIHANIYQKVASIGGYANLSDNNFERLFAYYQTYGKVDFQHCYMAEYYVPKLAQALQRFDGYKYSYDYYEALSWSGLDYTYEWQQMSKTQKDEIYRKINEINSGSKACTN